MTFGFVYRLRSVGILDNLIQFNLKYEDRKGGDGRTDALATVAQNGWDRQSSLTTFLHSDESELPSLDDVSVPERKYKLRTSNGGRIEHAAITKEPNILDE